MKKVKPKKSDKKAVKHQSGTKQNSDGISPDERSKYGGMDLSNFKKSMGCGS